MIVCTVSMSAQDNVRVHKRRSLLSRLVYDLHGDKFNHDWWQRRCLDWLSRLRGLLPGSTKQWGKAMERKQSETQLWGMFVIYFCKKEKHEVKVWSERDMRKNGAMRARKKALIVFPTYRNSHSLQATQRDTHKHACILANAQISCGPYPYFFSPFPLSPALNTFPLLIFLTLKVCTSLQLNQRHNMSNYEIWNLQHF